MFLVYVYICMWLDETRCVFTIHIEMRANPASETYILYLPPSFSPSIYHHVYNKVCVWERRRRRKRKKRVKDTCVLQVYILYRYIDAESAKGGFTYLYNVYTYNTKRCRLEYFFFFNFLTRIKKKKEKKPRRRETFLQRGIRSSPPLLFCFLFFFFLHLIITWIFFF